jgi:hypothetical protein
MKIIDNLYVKTMCLWEWIELKIRLKASKICDLAIGV